MGWGWKGAGNGEDCLTCAHFELDPMHSSKMVQKDVEHPWGTPKELGQCLERPVILDLHPFPYSLHGLDSITGNLGEEQMELPLNICAHRCRCTRTCAQAWEKGHRPPLSCPHLRPMCAPETPSGVVRSLPRPCQDSAP